jgi:molybdenum cofactor cytidylyltransferase
LVVAVLLAAGAGSRFRDDDQKIGHKLSAKLSKRGDPDDDSPTVLAAAIDAALTADIGPLVVVTGAAGDIVPDDLRDRVTICHNPRWADGQVTSLRRGIAEARRLGADAVVVGLGDQPFIDPTAWRTVADATGPIVVATYDGMRGNPVRLDATVWDLLHDHGDEGARALMRVRPELVREVPCTGSPADIDTTEDLRRWQNS